MSQRKDPCQRAACAIQKCLQENNYKESRCQSELQEMRLCCSKLSDRTSVCCSGFPGQQTGDGEEEKMSRTHRVS